jgi:hypothetical protein
MVLLLMIVIDNGDDKHELRVCLDNQSYPALVLDPEWFRKELRAHIFTVNQSSKFIKKSHMTKDYLCTTSIDTRERWCGESPLRIYRTVHSMVIDTTLVQFQMYLEAVTVYLLYPIRQLPCTVSVAYIRPKSPYDFSTAS